MQQRVFLWINGLLALGVALFALLYLFYFQGTPEFVQPSVLKQKSIPPKNPFQLPEQAYKQIQPALHLEFSEPNLSIPDLRGIITYYGTNKRPDADKANQKIYLSLGDSKNIFSIKSGETLYLVRNEQTKTLGPSPQNQPTALWIVAKPSGKDVVLEVYLKGVDGSIVRQPAERARFLVPEKPIPAQVGNVWYLGANRVDGTLLLKQKVKWHGPDLFLTEYGGPEYQDLQGKQRINFGEGDNQYSVFVGPGDVLIWKEDRWHVPQKGEKTQGYSLLEVKRVEDRVIGTELWDIEGKVKLPLNIIRAPTPMPNIELSKSFQFLGARTRIHSMFKIDGKREIVGVGDWFVLVDGEWQKIKKSKEIDQILDLELSGPLLILDRASHQVLIGKLFNGTHSEMMEVEIPLLPPSVKHEELKKGPEEMTQGAEKTKEETSNNPENPSNQEGG